MQYVNALTDFLFVFSVFKAENQTLAAATVDRIHKFWLMLAKIIIMLDNIASGIWLCVQFQPFPCYYLFKKNTFLASSSRLKLRSKRAKGDFVSRPCAHHCLCHSMSLSVLVTSPSWYFYYIWSPFSVSWTDYSEYVSVGIRLSNVKQRESVESMCTFSNNFSCIFVSIATE